MCCCVRRLGSMCRCLWTTPPARPSASCRTPCSPGYCWESDLPASSKQETNSQRLLLFPDWTLNEQQPERTNHSICTLRSVSLDLPHGCVDLLTWDLTNLLIRLNVVWTSSDLISKEHKDPNRPEVYTKATRNQDKWELCFCSSRLHSVQTINNLLSYEMRSSLHSCTTLH